MRKVKIANTDWEVSEIALGVMRMNVLSSQEAKSVIEAAIENGIDYFDHADIYGGGESEQVFGSAFTELSIPRDSVFLQSKTGIIPGKMYDFSKKHIIESVDGSLKRLRTDYLDALLLHRPDTLVEPEEVAEAFEQLEEQGKVRSFGVSNHNPMQIELLKKYVRQPLLINQLQMSVTHHPSINAGFNVNRTNQEAIVREGSILEYCRVNDITIQPWSPFQVGNEKEGILFDHPDFIGLNEVLAKLAEKYKVEREAIAIAWLLRHPAKMQPIIGSMNPKRIAITCRASDIKLSREEWYEVYRAGGFQLP
ncbi:aldo/keto reductase [Jeotgalibaca dankookensis]|uniref:aldo/keto reductase n=1 Tax=Jeotgalibaca dankookensis TaxID=708126 RepID=UPI0007864DD8|nr:aldo/keto reductase [Jeotgalibaca dankookensis]